MAEKQEKSKVPPIFIQHPEDGRLEIGRERNSKELRTKALSLKGNRSQHLTFYHDGGFELKTSEDKRAAEKGSTILSAVPGGTLVIKSLGDIDIQCEGRFSVVAKDIRMSAEGSPSESDITLSAQHNMNIQSDNYTILQSNNLSLHGKERFVANSNGWMMLIGQNVRIHEPKTKLCPRPLEDYINSQTEGFK
tara:strand:- start:1660 stop:2235 length:576 start_codon:yes stop_codon:yes gene_type:complete